MPTEDNKSIVRRYLEDVWDHGRFSAVRQYMDKDVADHAPAPGQPCGVEGQEWVARSFVSALSNYTLTIDNLVAEGDRVFDHWTASATQTGNFFGIPATGRQFTITGTDEYRLSNGKIVEIWHREDFLSLLQQLGQAPVPPLPRSFGRQTSPSGRSSTPPLPEQQVRSRIRDTFRELIERGNLNAIDQYVTQDFAGHYSAFPPVYGRDGFREFMSIYTTGLSDRRAEIQDIVVDGEWAAVRAVYHGKNTGSMFNMPATGKTVAVESLSIFRMQGDKAVEQWANNDDAGMMQQLGVMPEMAAAQPVPC